MASAISTLTGMKPPQGTQLTVAQTTSIAMTFFSTRAAYIIPRTERSTCRSGDGALPMTAADDS
jgi:hypothetical protein